MKYIREFYKQIERPFFIRYHEYKTHLGNHILKPVV